MTRRFKVATVLGNYEPSALQKYLAVVAKKVKLWRDFAT